MNPSADFDLEALVGAVVAVHVSMTKRATRAVNMSLTMRNWLMGAYIAEYELRGADRAAYGEKILEMLANRLRGRGIPRVDARELRRFRQFYDAYPQIRETLSPELTEVMSTAPALGIRETVSPKSRSPGRTLLERLSFSHLTELLKLSNTLERTFYEAECIRGGWSVRELRRQISSLYFERSGLSADKEKLATLAHKDAEPQSLALTIRDPYVFEFLGLTPRDVMGESELEDSLLDKVQSFLLELGHGFCFEARQKRILIGETHFFVDLVFYHRVLKCHVLIDLKVDEFKHEHIGQLNTYVSWYARHEMTEGDNPPIGILLCTRKNHALVEYALAAMNNQLFVSKYELVLPSREEIASFLEDKMRESVRFDVDGGAE